MRKKSAKVNGRRRDVGPPTETEDDGQAAFDRFAELTKKLVTVPKHEVDEARAAERPTN